MLRRLIGAMLFVCGAPVAGAAVEALHVYDVHVDAALTRLEVRACFADGVPDRLIADHALAIRATSEFRYRRHGRTVVARPRNTVVHFPDPADDDCVEWTSDLMVIADAKRLNIGYRAGGSLLLAPGTWFWRPPVLTNNRDIEFRLHLPPRMEISVPWQPVDEIRTAVARFRHGHMPLHWPALMALGKLHTEDIAVPGGRLRIAITDGPAKTDPVIVRRWLRAAALAASELWGEFPVDEQVQLLVIPLHEGRDAAPWAQTNRGGGPAVHLFMNAGAGWVTFREDWIATHELAHLALPFVRRTEAWLAEGIASYYQNVLRARLGLISPEAVWQSLQDGFARGNREFTDATLAEDSRQMHVRGRTLRVYWSGAAIALQADVALRARSGGEWSLDRVLQEFNRCCRKPERTWRARDLLATFDEISGTDVFGTLYETHVHSRHFPRLDETWARLGIRVEDGRVRMDSTEGKDLRSAIMASDE